MESTIKTVRPQVREFDEDLVRRLINTIKVNRRERLEIQFKSGIVMEQMVNYYDEIKRSSNRTMEATSLMTIVWQD